MFKYNPTHFITWLEAIDFTLMTFFGEWDLDKLTTEAFGKPLFIVLLTMSLIILVNLLIAMMGNTYQSVLDVAELEYQLAKTNIVNECSEELGSVMDCDA